MTHQSLEQRRSGDVHPSWRRQALNGIGGVLALLVTGLLILLLVLWKSP